jgi:hypothetical protein
MRKRASAESRPTSSQSVRSMLDPASCVGDDVDRSGRPGIIATAADRSSE